MIAIQILFILLAYILGSIPFGYIVGKLKGIDISKEGSKNIGATNVGRLLGKKYAILVFTLDTLKGAILVILFRFKIINNDYLVLSPILYGFIAAIGHSYSIFFKFKGGKAVSTSLGMMLGYSPISVLAILLTFFIVKKVCGLVSLGSLISAIVAFIVLLVFAIIGKDPTLNLPVDYISLIIALLTVVLIFVKHKANIQRIVHHEEQKSHY